MTLPEKEKLHAEMSHDDITDYQYLSAEFFIHYLRERFADADPAQIKPLLKAAMLADLHDAKLFNRLKKALDKDATIISVKNAFNTSDSLSEESSELNEIIDAYMSVTLECSSTVLNLLRHLIFFPLPSSRAQFIKEFKDSKQNAAMIPEMFWNAEDLSCVADYLDKNRSPK